MTADQRPAGEQGPGEQGPGEQRAGEQLRLLLDDLARRAQPWLNRMAAEHEPGHSPATCGWCPLCAGLAVLRGERPELAQRAAEHAAGLLAVLRSSLAEPGAPTAEPAATAEPVGEPTGAAPRPPAPRVQRITVRRRDTD